MLLRYKIANGLNPNTSDSDGDGFSDRYEMEFFNGDINAAKNATQKPSMTEEPYRVKKCNDTKCWLVPITSLILG